MQQIYGFDYIYLPLAFFEVVLDCSSWSSHDRSIKNSYIRYTSTEGSSESDEDISQTTNNIYNNNVFCIIFILFGRELLKDGNEKLLD